MILEMNRSDTRIADLVAGVSDEKITKFFSFAITLSLEFSA